MLEPARTRVTYSSLSLLVSVLSECILQTFRVRESASCQTVDTIATCYPHFKDPTVLRPNTLSSITWQDDLVISVYPAGMLDCGIFAA